MKIEKINDNQIRCTLTKEDLDSHQIRISELAYGTEKAKRLFRDMMQQAQIQFGFEADNIPLMIEAIPINAESIILIITKVEDPEELDTRFSKFAPFKGGKPSDTVEIDGADNIIDILSPTKEYLEQSNYQRVGVIGTKLMIKSHYFKKNLNKKVVELATPSLVPLIEKNEMDQTILDNYLKKLKDIDVLVLGCTHYKALTKYIKDLPLIELGSILTEKINLTNSKEGSITFYFSLVNEQIEKNVRKIFKDIDISEVTL